MIVVFSKDRAFQLEACLRSLLAQCRDVKVLPIRVVWTASQEMHERSYAKLRESFAPTANIAFVRESNFRTDVIAILGGLRPKSWQEGLMRRVERLPFSWLRQIARPFLLPVLRPVPAVLFVADDMLFLRPFLFTDCAWELLSTKEPLVFSLRLGQTVTRFSKGNRDQVVPELVPLEVGLGMCRFRWAQADGDFGFPMEMSCSLLKSEMILGSLIREEWRSPKTLAVALAKMAGRYREACPLVLTFVEPRAVLSKKG